MATINVFIGTGAQVPAQYQVEGTTYWDLIKNLIQFGMNPGSLYGLNGEVINSADPIIFPELNYIIAGGSPFSVAVTAPSIDDKLGPILHYNIFCRRNSSIAEVKRSALAQGACAPALMYRGQILIDNDTLESYGIVPGTTLNGFASLGTGDCFRYI